MIVFSVCVTTFFLFPFVFVNPLPLPPCGNKEWFDGLKCQICTPCLPGERVKHNCNTYNNTLCIPCEKKHFSTKNTWNHHCDACTTIDQCYTGGDKKQLLIGECTPTKDTKCICPEGTYFTVSHFCDFCSPPCDPKTEFEDQPCLPEPEGMNRVCKKKKANSGSDNEVSKCVPECSRNEVCQTNFTECVCQEGFARDCDRICKLCDEKLFSCKDEYIGCSRSSNRPTTIISNTTTSITTDSNANLPSITLGLPKLQTSPYTKKPFIDEKTTQLQKNDVHHHSQMSTGEIVLLVLLVFIIPGIGLVTYINRKCSDTDGGPRRPTSDNRTNFCYHDQPKSFDINLESLIFTGEDTTVLDALARVLNDNQVLNLTKMTIYNDSSPYNTLKEWAGLNGKTFKDILTGLREDPLFCETCIVGIAEKYNEKLSEDDSRSTSCRSVSPSGPSASRDTDFKWDPCFGRS